jgi:hypothetical protein
LGALGYFAWGATRSLKPLRKIRDLYLIFVSAPVVLTKNQVFQQRLTKGAEQT